jgi:vacuolar protein sorting-associated protein 8
MNGTQKEQHSVSLDRSESPVFSDTEVDGQDDGHLGDYSTRLEELMSDDEGHSGDQEDSDDDEGERFVYSGVDAEPAGTYREQLRDVLGPDHDDDDAYDPLEVEQDVLHDIHEKEMFEASLDDEARVSMSTR